MTRLWHPFADMSAVSQRELVIERGEGPWVWDVDGNRYLDGSASLWYANIGHGRGEVAEAVARQMRQIESYSIFGDFGNAPANSLAQRLSDLAPIDDAYVFLCVGGGDAIDTAAKLARRHWSIQGQPQRQHLIGRAHGYHGTHGFGTSLGGIPANVSDWGPLIPDTSIVEYGSVDALAAEFERVGVDNVAAFFCEPVIGAGGVYPPPDGYIEAVAKLCADSGVLFIVDSVICAFGRLGSWFGIERWEGVVPDMITFAKGVTSGYLPLGGVIVSDAIAKPYFESGGPVLRHGQTYAGHPTCCAAAHAVLDIYEGENLIPRGRELEATLYEALLTLSDEPAVAEVRGGVGLLGAVGLDGDLMARDPGAVARLISAVRKEGVIVRPLLGAVAVSPPLIVEEQHLTMIVDALRLGLRTL